jgi:hypothetical protein
MPQVDRVCLTSYANDNLMVEQSAYPGDVATHFAERGFAQNGGRFALAYYALTNVFAVHDDLKKARALDLRAMSGALGSSVHVPVILGQRPGTLNFWSKQTKAFPDAAPEQFQALADAVTHGQPSQVSGR